MVDANGLPVVGVAVYWLVATGNGALQTFMTVTDINGLASNSYSGSTGSQTTLPSFTSVITASVGNSTATFYETQATSAVRVVSSLPASLSGTEGSVGAPMTVTVGSSSGGPIAGVEMRLVNGRSSPSVSCVPGAAPGDPGNRAHDSTGTATCTPLLAGSGTGQFSVLVGGTVAATTGEAAGYAIYGPFQLSVTVAVAGSIQPVGGNNQTAAAGQSLIVPLQAVVKDVNGNPLPGQAVNWSVSPAGAGTFNSASHE